MNNTPTSFIDPSGFTADDPMDEITVTGRRWNGGVSPRLYFQPSVVLPFAGGTFASEEGDRRGSLAAIDEIIVTGVTHRGSGSATIFMGASGAISYFGIFDASGNAGVLGTRVGEANTGVSGIVDQAAGIMSLLSDGLEVAADAHLSTFSAALFSQPFRRAQVAKLGRLLKPIKLFATKLGITGLVIDVGLGLNTFFTTGNPVPLFVSGIGFGVGTVIAAYSAPAALGFAVAYGAAGYFGLFDSDHFD